MSDLSDLSALFQPFRVRGLELPNRIVMAPMTRSFSPGGVPGADVAAYYARRAGAEVGLIVTEGTVTDRKGASGDPDIPRFHGADALAGWSQVRAAVHAAGGRIAPQIWHQGMVRKPGTGHYPDAPSDSPSGVTHAGKAVAEPPSESDVHDMAAAYARAAAEAARLGFDAIEIHGAHGYLIDQFFWEVMNRREDRYGGGLRARSAFAAEIVSMCRAAVGPDMPIILRFSQWKQQDYNAKLARDPAELADFLEPLADAGVDVFHCSQRRIWEAEFPEIDGADGLNCAGWTKKITGLPVISVGSVGLSSDFVGAFRGEGSQRASLDGVAARVAKGEYDLVAVGRALLQDPDWAAKVHAGRLDDLSDYDPAVLGRLW